MFPRNPRSVDTDIGEEAMEDLLRDIAENGWTEDRAMEVYQSFNEQIKRYIIYCLAKMGFITSEEDLLSLGRYMNGR